MLIYWQYFTSFLANMHIYSRFIAPFYFLPLSNFIPQYHIRDTNTQILHRKITLTGENSLNVSFNLFLTTQIRFILGKIYFQTRHLFKST
jgi:hypothetical protein